MLDHGYLSALTEERERRDKIIDGLADGIMVHDDHQIIYAFNSAAEALTGYSRDEVIGKHCHQIFGERGLCGGQCDFQHGAPAPFARKSRDVVLTTKDGEDRQIRLLVNHIETDKGRPNQVVANMHDVTELRALRRRARTVDNLHGMVGMSSPMQEVFETIRQVAASDYSTLIFGESGTGKELAANAVHQESKRQGGPFVPINCGALPENILESELFGHVRGAFTGAIREKKGRFEMAHGGTLFLDEVGELTPGFQVKLLRVLQERRFEKVGGERSIGVDVRIVAATNRNLKEMVANQEFRQDLFYRLCVVPITLPPLRDRLEDIPLIIQSIMAQIRRESGKDIRRISDDAMSFLMSYRWPGNVRELINSLQYASVRCVGNELKANHLPPDITEPATAPVAPPTATLIQRQTKLTEEALRQALAETGGNKAKAAKLLGVGRATLYRFLKDHPVA
ncbi:MAG: sigma 54-interacting transcriptional regulator [Proteobacteria bacterium]|nr:sigma 54-interacting transcriptional regulator [Pseudomonadota bacterium]